MSHGWKSKNTHDAESLLQGQEALSRVALAKFSLNEANWKKISQVFSSQHLTRTPSYWVEGHAVVITD